MVDGLESEDKNFVNAISDTKDVFFNFSNGQTQNGTKNPQLQNKPFSRFRNLVV